MTKEQKRKLINTIFIILITLAVILYVGIYIGDMSGWKAATEAKNWVENNIGIVFGGSFLSALGVAYSVLLKALTKVDSGTSTLSSYQTKISDLAEGVTSALTSVNTACEKVNSEPDTIAALKALATEQSDKINLIKDIMLAYVVKNTDNKTVAQIEAAFQTSELLKNVRALQEAQSAVESAPIMVTKKTADEIKQTVSKATAAVKGVAKSTLAKVQ